ncbi:MAG: hypothetical protein D6811_03635 [Alphaproteobacteria bacterium]|nr:MAG: hypothetical protein D6811_03635 [Alphaproteobacteria bacterium]
MQMPPAAMLAELGAVGAAGAALGLVHLALLGRSVRLVLEARAGGRGQAVALSLLRLGLAALALWLAAQRGAGPLLALAAGFLLARQLRLRRELERLEAKTEAKREGRP